MNANETVYGLKENWQQQYFSQSVQGNAPEPNKCPSFTSENYSQLYYALQNNRVETDKPLDLSICYCGLGTESDCSHVHSIVNDNGTLVKMTINRDITNFFFWERTGTSYIVPTNGAIALDSTYSWHGNIGTDNMHAQISPICQIGLKNQVFSIHVKALSADKQSSTDVTLLNYLSAYENYPNVVCVYAKSWNGYNIPRGSNLRHFSDSGNIEFGMGLLDPYCNYNGDENIYCFCVEQHPNTSVYTPTQNMFILSGSLQYDNYVRIGNDNIPVLRARDVDEWTVEFYPNSTQYVYIYKTITKNTIQTFYNNCIRQMACFGLYFSPSDTVAISGNYTDENMYIGVLDSNGIGHGNFLKGNETVTAPQNNYNTMNDSPYDGNNPHQIDNTVYTNNTLFQNQLATQSAIRYYVMNAEKVGQLFAKLHDATISNQQTGESITDTNLKTLLTTNGIDVITSFMKFPCNPPSYTGPFTTIHLGTYDTGIVASMLQYQTAIYDFTFNRAKNNSLREHYDGSFLDREEYTKAELTIPFCGTVEIPTTYLYEYDDLTVKLIIDFITGACTAIILAHDIAIDSISGSCGVQLPVTGVQSASLNAALDSIAKYGKTQERSQGAQLLGGFAAMGLGIATGNIFATAAGGLTMLNSLIQTANTATQINYELTHMQLPLKQVGGASAAINQTLDMRCKLRITRPVMLDGYDAKIYAKNIGFACLINGVVNDFTDFTVGDISTDGISATTDEKNMIQTLFKTGVVL